jgi:hypothetical protein
MATADRRGRNAMNGMLEHRRLRVARDHWSRLSQGWGSPSGFWKARQRELRRTAGLLMSEVATLECLEDLQRRLLRGECLSIFDAARRTQSTR